MCLSPGVAVRCARSQNYPPFPNGGAELGPFGLPELIKTTKQRIKGTVRYRPVSNPDPHSKQRQLAPCLGGPV